VVYSVSNWTIDQLETTVGIINLITNSNLFKNNLTGNIPKEIGLLINLVSLYLFITDFSALNNNQLTGNIPKEFGNLVSLCYLNVSCNLLRGQVPRELSNLKKLEFLDFSGNQLFVENKS